MNTTIRQGQPNIGTYIPPETLRTQAQPPVPSEKIIIPQPSEKSSIQPHHARILKTSWTIGSIFSEIGGCKAGKQSTPPTTPTIGETTENTPLSTDLFQNYFRKPESLIPYQAIPGDRSYVNPLLKSFQEDAPEQKKERLNLLRQNLSFGFKNDHSRSWQSMSLDDRAREYFQTRSSTKTNISAPTAKLDKIGTGPQKLESSNSTGISRTYSDENDRHIPELREVFDLLLKPEYTGEAGGKPGNICLDTRSLKRPEEAAGMAAQLMNLINSYPVEQRSYLMNHIGIMNDDTININAMRYEFSKGGVDWKKFSRFFNDRNMLREVRQARAAAAEKTAGKKSSSHSSWNTLPAIEKGLKKGEIVEIDIVSCKDGLAVFHAPESRRESFRDPRSTMNTSLESELPDNAYEHPYRSNRKIPHSDLTTRELKEKFNFDGTPIQQPSLSGLRSLFRGFSDASDPADKKETGGILNRIISGFNRIFNMNPDSPYQGSIG